MNFRSPQFLHAAVWATAIVVWFVLFKFENRLVYITPIGTACWETLSSYLLVFGWLLPALIFLLAIAGIGISVFSQTPAKGLGVLGNITVHVAIFYSAVWSFSFMESAISGVRACK